MVSATINPALSNAKWQSKREQLREHSSLLITQRYLGEAWDEAAIRTRATALIDSLIKVWPGPDGTFSKPAEH